MGAWLQSARHWARRIKQDVLALWIAARDRETPLAARIIATLVAACAVSPIDLIPDFIPVLGLLDDVIIVPLGVLLAVRLIPPTLMDRFRNQASELTFRPVSVAALAVFVMIWIALAVFFAQRFWPATATSGP